MATAELHRLRSELAFEALVKLRVASGLLKEAQDALKGIPGLEAARHVRLGEARAAVADADESLRQGYLRLLDSEARTS